MLARSKIINLPCGKPLATPILLPSFSSKGFPELRKIVQQLVEYLGPTPILISAYDLKYKFIQAKMPSKPELIFVDSGGYECSSITDFIENDRYSYKTEKWDETIYFKAISAVFKNNKYSSKAIISFDHPQIRYSFRNQIRSADIAFEKFSEKGYQFFKEIIIKPTTRNKNKQFISIDPIVRNIKELGLFDIIGFTEKELGSSLLEIMVNICRVRQALTKNGMDQLIHIFGVLDPIATPLYFMCGADIFDGLSWLRYSFDEDLTIYQQNYWFKKKYPLDSKNFAIKLRCFTDNLVYLKTLYFQMIRFQKSNDFSNFGKHANLFKDIWATVETKI